MIKVRLYDTPNRLSYVGYDYNRKHGWFSIHILKKDNWNILGKEYISDSLTI